MPMLFEVTDPKSKRNLLINFDNVTHIWGTDTEMVFSFASGEEIEIDISYSAFRDGFFERYNIKKVNVFEKEA